MSTKRMRHIIVRARCGLIGAVLLVCAAGLCVPARAQGPVTHSSEDASPPLMRYVPAEIRSQLDNESDLKDRTRLSLELAEQRLARAAQETIAEHYDQAGSELGIYEAVVEEAIHFLQKASKVKNKSRDLFKRIELSLRSHIPRLETIRRSTPSVYAVHIKEAIEFVRESRTEALNSFYDDTVLPDPSGRNEKPTGDERTKGASSSPEKEKKPTQRR